MTTTAVASDDGDDNTPASVQKGEAIMRPGGFAVTSTSGARATISSVGDADISSLAVGRLTSQVAMVSVPTGGRSLEDSKAAHPSAIGGPRVFASDVELFALTGVPRGGRVYVATIGGRHYVGLVDDVVVMDGRPQAVVLSELEVDTWCPPTWTAGPGVPEVIRVAWHTVDRIEAR